MDTSIPDDFLLTVVMPVYNEERTLAEAVEAVLRQPTRKELILIDDGSTDASREILRTLEQRPGVRVLLHEQNLGKGAALRTGFDAARGDVVVVQDADLVWTSVGFAAQVGDSYTLVRSDEVDSDGIDGGDIETTLTFTPPTDD